jgi:hypothetical protein
MAEITILPGGRISVFHKNTDRIACRVSEDAVHIWDKVNKTWEPFTWEELRAIVEAHKAKMPVTV